MRPPPQCPQTEPKPHAALNDSVTDLRCRHHRCLDPHSGVGAAVGVFAVLIIVPPKVSRSTIAALISIFLEITRLSWRSRSGYVSMTTFRLSIPIGVDRAGKRSCPWMLACLRPRVLLVQVDRESVLAAIANERRQIATLIDGLGDAQLATPSLCAGWDVKTVAAHLACSVIEGFSVTMRRALRCGSLAQAIDELARCRAQQPAAELVATLRQRADYPLSPPVFGPRAPFADILIHSGDIKIPLNLPFEPDPEQVAFALDFLTGLWPFGFVPLGRLRGISLHGTDIDRSWGSGAEVRGPTAALMMAVSGRTALLQDLDGPGLPLLRSRLSA